MALKFENITTILLDIEGTICPISFVKDVMYPAALTTLNEILSEKDSPFPPPELEKYIAAFPAETTKSKDTFLKHIQSLTSSDSKDASLKALQGYLWKTSFENGTLQAPLYPDVSPTLRQWNLQGKTLAIFSSGSVNAQKLFLTHTGIEGLEKTQVASDLTGLFNGHFDTVNAGPKGDKESYVTIAAELEVERGDVLFLSDNVTEVRAAIEAGMKAVVVDRPGNKPLEVKDKEELTIITTLEDLDV